MNVVVVKGRIVHTPELKTTQSGVSVCNFTIAIDRRFSQNGEKITDFFDVVAWRSTGEFVSKWFDKGKEILVNGELQSRTYQTKDGSNRKAIEIIASQVDFCGSKSTGDSKPVKQSNPTQEPDFATIDADDEDLPF